MRVCIAGQKWFAAEALRRLAAAGVEIGGVIAPDAADRLAMVAVGAGVPVRIVPPGLPITAADIDGAELVVTAYCHNVVSGGARSAARLGAIGYHPSLLPRHRGRDAVEATIRAGDMKAGGTVYRLTDRMDAGPILAQAECNVRVGEDAASLWRRALAPMGLDLLEAVVMRLLRGGAIPERPQEAA